MIKKNTSDLIEPLVFELGTCNSNGSLIFRTSNRISPASLVSRTLVKRNEAATIPVEATNQSVRKSNLWYHWRFRSYLITGQWIILAASFLQLGLPSTIICHENGRSPNENTVETRGIWKRRLCVLMWTENIFKTELFQNDYVMNSSNTNPVLRFQISPTKCGRKTFDVLSEWLTSFSNFSAVVWTGDEC